MRYFGREEQHVPTSADQQQANLEALAVYIKQFADGSEENDFLRRTISQTLTMRWDASRLIHTAVEHDESLRTQPLSPAEQVLYNRPDLVIAALKIAGFFINYQTQYTSKLKLYGSPHHEKARVTSKDVHRVIDQIADNLFAYNTENEEAYIHPRVLNIVADKVHPSLEYMMTERKTAFAHKKQLLEGFVKTITKAQVNSGGSEQMDFATRCHEEARAYISELGAEVLLQQSELANEYNAALCHFLSNPVEAIRSMQKRELANQEQRTLTRLSGREFNASVIVFKKPQQVHVTDLAEEAAKHQKALRTSAELDALDDLLDTVDSNYTSSVRYGFDQKDIKDALEQVKQHMPTKERIIKIAETNFEGVTMPQKVQRDIKVAGMNDQPVTYEKRVIVESEGDDSVSATVKDTDTPSIDEHDAETLEKAQLRKEQKPVYNPLESLGAMGVLVQDEGISLASATKIEAKTPAQMAYASGALSPRRELKDPRRKNKEREVMEQLEELEFGDVQDLMLRNVEQVTLLPFRSGASMEHIQVSFTNDNIAIGEPLFSTSRGVFSARDKVTELKVLGQTISGKISVASLAKELSFHITLNQNKDSVARKYNDKVIELPVDVQCSLITELDANTYMVEGTIAGDHAYFFWTAEERQWVMFSDGWWHHCGDELQMVLSNLPITLNEHEDKHGFAMLLQSMNLSKKHSNGDSSWEDATPLIQLAAYNLQDNRSLAPILRKLFTDVSSPFYIDRMRNASAYKYFEDVVHFAEGIKSESSTSLSKLLAHSLFGPFAEQSVLARLDAEPQMKRVLSTSEQKKTMVTFAYNVAGKEHEQVLIHVTSEVQKLGKGDFTERVKMVSFEHVNDHAGLYGTTINSFGPFAEISEGMLKELISLTDTDLLHWLPSDVKDYMLEVTRNAIT